MKHLGDITTINGAEIEPVDCISFGSPCQDLSLAGKRAGLDGERSRKWHEEHHEEYLAYMREYNAKRRAREKGAKIS